MKVSELGEFGLIDLLAKMANAPQAGSDSGQPLIIGIGDDAAAWRGDTSTQLATVDSLIQDVHFPSGLTSWEEVGWRAMAANLSDIAAMGGQPRYALASLALPGDTEVADVTALYRGMLALAEQHGVVLIGGDTCRAPLVIITITVLGNTKDPAQPILTRATARPGESVAVTGELGTAAAGLRVLTEKLQLNAEATNSLKNAFLHPCPRIAEGQLLVEHGIRTAIDISDGLVADLNHICTRSQVGARIEVDRVPIHPAVKANFGDKALELALAGGEDYELLFTGQLEVINKVKAAAACPITVIGEIVADKDQGVTLVDSEGTPVNLGKTGWEHFTPE